MLHAAVGKYASVWLLGLLLALAPLAPVLAQASDGQEPDSRVVLEQAQDAIGDIQKQLQPGAKEPDDARLAQMRETLQNTQEKADEIATRLQPELDSVQARLKELGEPAPDAAEPADIAQRRKTLSERRAELDAQIKLARLIAVEARQEQDKVAQQRRLQFQAELGRRSASILSPRFWRDVERDLPRDFRRLAGAGREVAQALGDAPPRVWGESLLYAVLVLLVGGALRRGMTSFTIRHIAPSRLRRSLYASMKLALYTLVPGLLILIALSALRWKGDLSPALDAFLQQCAAAACLAGFVTGLGVALLSPGQPTWRLPSLPEELAGKLAWLPATFAIMMALAWTSQQLLDLVNASLSSTLLINSLTTVTLNMLIGFAAWSLRARIRQVLRARMQEGGGAEPALSLWARSVPSVLVVTIGVSLLAFLLGFIALSSLIVQEIIWLGLVVCTAYLLVALTEDLFNSLLARIRAEGESGYLTNSQLRTRSQLTILVSGALRLAFVVMAVTLVLLPFGENPGDWLFRRLGFLANGFQVGEVLIRPVSIVMTVAVLLVGFYAARLLRGWLTDQLLPATRLDPSMRASAANLFTYLAYFIVLAMAISALGVGLERMAWIISALSVGIGFGLQAVVQNFVSGVILVAERPIKVGDWVSLDGVEGNVRRINARATEIELFDRSTMIVPNSEFITKKVRNVTLTNPLGVVSLKINMPVNVDADKVRDIMFAAIRAVPEVLEKPAPSVALSGFNLDSLVFEATCFVDSPRNAANARSTLMFETLRRLRKADLQIHPTQAPQEPPPAAAAEPAPPPAPLPPEAGR